MYHIILRVRSLGGGAYLFWQQAHNLSMLEISAAARGGDHVLEMTLRPTPYTLHLAPYTPHPTLHTLHPAPDTLQPTPFTLYPTPLTPDTLHPAPLTPDTLHSIPYTLHPDPETLNQEA